MIRLRKNGVFLRNMKDVTESGAPMGKEEARRGTIAYSILRTHTSNPRDMTNLNITFDAMASHDITYVNIIQTARASGLTEFPLPYVLTNCHNSLCAVGGTINEDDHLFGLTASQRYGGIYVPAHQAVIHQYMREMMAGCGKMILGSDSHTRYGALGAMAIGEGGGELVKQLLRQTYDLPMPEIVGVYLTGEPRDGVGPQDAALAIIKAVFAGGFVKNKIMEFIGDGIAGLSLDYRNGIDVMTTETTCLSSIWQTDDKVKAYYETHGRGDEYRELKPGAEAYYDSFISVDLSRIKPMIALPFHPSNVYTIDELNANLDDILRETEVKGGAQLGKASFSLRDKVRDGRLYADQGVIAGCAGGTFENICDAADILRGKSIGNGEFALSVYPSSQPVFLELTKNGAAADIMESGAVVRSAFCGPCFGAGDVPFNNGLSIRHTTRNFPSREGSKPANGQVASVALMDARSVAATAINNGAVTPATDADVRYIKPAYYFNKKVYDNRVYNGYGRPDPSVRLKLGPNITDWPEIPSLPEHLLLKVASYITDPVTTTDELIPSGDTSSYRSNPIALSEFTLSRKDPAYVRRAKDIRGIELKWQSGGELTEEWKNILNVLGGDYNPANTGVGSVIYAVKPGDGSAREQAASCQRVLGGRANIVKEYATKRYCSNLINWGILPFVFEEEPPFGLNDVIFAPDARKAVENGAESLTAYVMKDNAPRPFKLQLKPMTGNEAAIILAGCLMNYYRDK
ncbi:MAG: hydratase [Clostridiales bacterium]|jgi:aconitate hydratase|nr:hydratase [Clostridiales bacterium]